MSRFKFLLAMLAVLMATVSLAAHAVQAEVRSSASTTTVVYLPLVLRNYQPPPPAPRLLNKIVYSSGYTSANKVYNIYVASPDGSSQTPLTNQNGSRYLKPTWSPDGTKIAFYTITTVGSDIVDETYVMNADGSGMFNLVTAPGHHFDPAWSPYGDRIAFSSDLFSPGKTTPNDIYVIAANGSGSPVNLTNSPTVHEAWPDWSPDGKKIVLVSCDSTFTICQIHVMNSDGSGRTNISNSPYDDYAPNWSPDGQKIAFDRNLGTGTSPRSQIFVMNADGSGQVQLTNNAGQNFYPNWSPDGSKIAFQTYYSNYADIYTMNANGTGITNITNHQYSYASVQPDWR